jgi:hypothetical protein
VFVRHRAALDAVENLTTLAIIQRAPGRVARASLPRAANAPVTRLPRLGTRLHSPRHTPTGRTSSEEQAMTNAKAKPAGKKHLKKTLLNPVKNLKTTDSFLQIDGLKGESTDAEHKDWIEIHSFNS